MNALTSPPNDILAFDAMMMGLERFCAVYIIRGGKNVLIDAGTRDGAPALVDFLKARSIVPHIVIVTHSHHDHIGAITPLREAFGPIEVLCGPGGRERLRDPNEINRLFTSVEFESIDGATEIADGQTVDIGGRTLTVLHTPGHSEDSISILDDASNTLFPGDLPGDWLWGSTYLSTHITPDFDEGRYFASTDRLLALDHAALAIPHYGVFTGADAHDLLRLQKERYLRWRDVLTGAFNRTGDARSLEPPLKGFFAGSPFESLPGYDALIAALAGWCVMGYRSAGIIT